MTIRVLLVDDQMLVCQGLQSLLALAEGIDVVATAADGQVAVDFLLEQTVDVVLMDIRMPRCDGLQALALLREKHIEIPVLMLTTFDDHHSIMTAIRAGAKGYLLKDVSLETLVEAIRCLHNGGTWLQPSLTERLLTDLQTAPPSVTSELAEPLSDKETEVLRLMAAGLSNQEIAEALHKSTGTVKNQVSTVLAKLGVQDRTRAVLKALELGLLVR